MTTENDCPESSRNLVHQSTKDYLLGEHLKENKQLAQYYVNSDKANLLMFQICWRYLGMEEFDRGEKIIRRGADHRLFEYLSFSIYIKDFCFLEYASREWLSHALAASPALTTDY